MPDVGYTNRNSTNQKSELSPGWRYGYLLAIHEEDTPITWKMYATSKRMYRWVFALWETADRVGRVEPERQIERKVAGGDPREQRLVDLPVLRRHGTKRQHLHHGECERHHHDQRGEAAGHGLRQPLSEERVDQEAAERQQGNQR